MTVRLTPNATSADRAVARASSRVCSMFSRLIRRISFDASLICLNTPSSPGSPARPKYAAARSGEACGLTTELLKTQEQFLTEILAEMCQDGVNRNLSHEEVRQFQTLTHPGHLGRAFKVLVQRRA